MVETMTDRLTEAWARTDRIFEILAPGAWLAQPIALRHPFIFYLGHLPAFAWNHVGGELLGRPTFNAGFDDLFSRGIDPDVDDGVTITRTFHPRGRRCRRCSPIATTSAPRS